VRCRLIWLTLNSRWFAARSPQTTQLSSLGQLGRRVPTVSFTLDGWNPREVAAALDKDGIYVWDGNYYALAVTERLGLEDKGGMVRVGAAHYNTLEEIEKLVASVKSLMA
jgi:selenocysteine lyase/cysteine desulfurase